MKFVFLVASALSLLACGSEYSQLDPVDLSLYKSPPAQDVNVLVKYQTRLAIPPGWKFVRREKKPTEKSGVKTADLFKFNDGVDNVYGRVEYTVLDLGGNRIAPDKLGKVFTEELLTNVSEKTLRQTYIDGEESYIVTGKDNEKGWDFVAALVPEDNAFNQLQLLSNPGYLRANLPLAYRIFSSYKYEPKGAAERKIVGNISFRCMDGAWYWLDDWNVANISGYFVTDDADKETPIAALGLATTEYASIQSLQAAFKEFNETVVGTEFDAEIPVGGSSYPVKGIATKNDKNYLSAYYLFQAAGRGHLVVVIYKEGDVAFPPPELHAQWTIMNDTLRKYFSL